jgi:ribosomal protein S18 acetylase RimI-like enzyme
MTLGTCTEYRGLGLGSLLIKKCIQHAEMNYRDRCGVIYLHVIVTNDAAIKFYEKLGFDRITEIQNYYTIDNQHYNCYLYAKYINGMWV